MMVSHPMRPSSSTAACSATAPRTLGSRLPRGRERPSKPPRRGRPGRRRHRRRGRITRSECHPRAHQHAGAKGHASCGRSRPGSRPPPASVDALRSGWRRPARHPALVGRGDDLVDRWRPAGDVGCTGHCQQPRTRSDVERGGDISGREGAVRTALDEAPQAQPSPGQQVGVVLNDGGHDDVVGSQSEPVGQVVDGLGGVVAIMATSPPSGRPAKPSAAARAAS